MSWLEAIILGIVQGITEFLPISSTGHLTLAGKFMNLISDTEPEKWTSFIAVIQLGTLAAILVYFWRDLYNISKDFLKENLIQRKRFIEQSSDSKMGWLIIFGSVPIILIGLLFKDFIEGAFTKSLVVIGISLIVLGIILAIAERVGKFQRDMSEIKISTAIIIGLAQAVALIPGSSRSGTTITAGLFVGLKREAAARFSFLLSVPAIFGSGLLQFYQSLEYLNYSESVNMLIATVVSAISGYLAIEFLLRYLRKNSTFIFVFYRVILGLVILGLIGINYIQP